MSAIELVLNWLPGYEEILINSAIETDAAGAVGPNVAVTNASEGFSGDGFGYPGRNVFGYRFCLESRAEIERLRPFNFVAVGLSRLGVRGNDHAARRVV